jgi:acyl-CoA synthetase (AMP-forming)/AMP-acid ligase II
MPSGRRRVTVADSRLTVAEIVRQQSRRRGDHPLLVCDAERLSYADADRRSAHLARGLIALGAGKGTHVGMLFPNGAAWVVAMLAAARIGATVIPFSTFATAPEMREQLVDSDVEILLATTSYRSHDYPQRLADILGDNAFGSGERLLCTAVPHLRHVLIDSEPADTVDESLLEALERDVDASDPLAIVYTSGSTSSPKGAVHTHASLLEHQKVLNEIRGLTAQDKLFCNSPFFWIGGIAFAVLATLLAGSTLVCSNAIDPADTLDLLEAERPTMTNGFVAGIAHLARHPSLPLRDLSSMRRGNLYPIMAPDVRPADPELRHTMLGMTESGSVITISEDESDQPERRRGSFGRPAPGFDTKVLDPDTGDAVDVGEIGELCVRGPFMMQRYHKRSREECFDPDGWFHTGDLVRTDGDGFVYFVGRRGAMIKTAGANVAPAEVERAIAKVTGGTVAHVVGIADPERGQLVAAVIALEAGADFDGAALRERLKAELSAYKIPRRFAAVPRSEIPVLSSGKVDIAHLTKLFDA